MVDAKLALIYKKYNCRDKRHSTHSYEKLVSELFEYRELAEEIIGDMEKGEQKK